MNELRPYQKEALDAIKNHLSICKRQMVSLPTGAGKTVLFCSTIDYLNVRSMVVVHRIDLLSQTEKTMKEWIPHKKLSVLDKTIDPEADIFLCMIQAANNRLAILKELGIQLLIVDEAHHASAPSYKKLVEHLGFFEKDKLLIGFTATPDEKNSDIFEKIVFHRTLFDLIREGWLCPLVGKRIYTTTSLKELSQPDKQVLSEMYDQGERNEKDKDFNENKLKHIVNTFERNSLIVKSYLELASDRKRTVCFCASREHSQNMAKMFCENGIKAVHLEGDDKPEYREEVYEKLHKGEIQMITNCNLMTEGNDIKPIDCIVMARPTRSDALYTQMIGRGARKHLEKDNCLILDFNDKDCEIVTLAELVKKEEKINEDEVSIKSEWEYEEDYAVDREYQYKNSDLVHSSGKIIDMDIDFEYSSEKLSQFTRADYNPALPYGKSRYEIIPATENQIRSIRKFIDQGHIKEIDLDVLSKAKASKIIARYCLKNDRPTDKMADILRKYDEDPEDYSYKEAHEFIGLLAQNGWKKITRPNF